MAEQFTEAQLKIMYPNSPRLWPSLVPEPVLSNDPRRRAAQIAYPLSESMWPDEPDLGAELARLEKLYNDVAQTYPASAAAMVRHEVVASQNKVLAEMAVDQREIDSMKAELAAQE